MDIKNRYKGVSSIAERKRMYNSILPEPDQTDSFHFNAFNAQETISNPIFSLHGLGFRFSQWKAAFYISCALKKASLTVEAAIALPIFLGTMVLLLQVLDLYRVQGLLTLSLQESALDLSVMESVLEPEENEKESEGERIPELAVCIAYASARLPKEALSQGSVSLLGSSVSGDKLILEAVWTPRNTIRILSLPLIRISARAAVHFFHGRGPEDLAGNTSQPVEMVYVTEYESVYHTDASCSHIALSVHAISAGSLAQARNKSGAHYGSCERCVGNGVTAGTVYVSDYGSKYHNSAECSGLKRTVRLVPKNSVSGLPHCSKCAAAGG